MILCQNNYQGASLDMYKQARSVPGGVIQTINYIMSVRKFVSRNPVNNKLLSSFDFISEKELEKSIARSSVSYDQLRKSGTSDIEKRLNRVSGLIENNVDKYAMLITGEMGKPLREARAEVKKAAAYCRYYAEFGSKFVRSQRVKTEANHSYVQMDPIGPVFFISPFNFPFWLSFKPTISSLILGNPVLLRPSDSTPMTGQAIEELFVRGGFDQGEFQTILSAPDQTEKILSDDRVQGVSFTGSTAAGKNIASMAGRYLKRNVMELGGMDPFMVFKDADINKAVQLAIRSRTTNCGQVCFSAKRFIINQDRYEEFKTKLVEQLQAIKVGDPLDDSTSMGPMARWDLVTKLNEQIRESVKQGGIVLSGGESISKSEKDGNFVPPTVIECTSDNSIFKDESFGPVFPLVVAKDDQEIIKISNQTSFGLGAVIVSESPKVKELINQIDAGMVFVNETVKSDQRLPSGGIKQSGYGRECGEWGVTNFANIKTVWIQ